MSSDRDTGQVVGWDNQGEGRGCIIRENGGIIREDGGEGSSRSLVGGIIRQYAGNDYMGMDYNGG